MFKEIVVPIENLLLDPNNPRFIDDLGERVHIPDDMLEAKQEETLEHFSRKAKTDETEFDVTNIKDLYDSMLRIGFVGIDRIVVRSVKGSSKYLVLEGNRRIATVRTILNNYEKRIIKSPSERHDVEAHLASYKNIKAMLLNTEGLSKEQVDHHVSIILGIRHHGSLLEWEPLPRAFNIYKEYMDEDPATSAFKLDNEKAREVANRLCIDRADERLMGREEEREFLNQLEEIKEQVQTLRPADFRGLKSEIELILKIRDMVDEKLWPLAKRSSRDTQ